MFHSRQGNRTMSKLHERVLSLVYHDYNSSFQTLLEKIVATFSFNHQIILCLQVEDLQIFHRWPDHEILKHIKTLQIMTYVRKLT